MIITDELEIWNLSQDGIAVTGPQPIFNIVGRLKDADRVARLCYRLNHSPEREIYVNRKQGRTGRMERHGDFNIDTLRQDELGPTNRLVFSLATTDGQTLRREFTFRQQPCACPQPVFQLDLSQADAAEQVGQIVDGRWRIARGEGGQPCLEINPADAGYDRIILFGSHAWETGYEITSRFVVPEFTRPTHNVGLIFKWNPHAQGDGTHLPTEWNTGLAYFSAYLKGLRIRYGLRAQNIDGQRVGDHVLHEKVFSPWRYWLWRAKYDKGLPALALRKRLLFFIRRPFSQLRPHRPYHIRMQVHPRRYALSLWPEGQPEPEPLVVEHPRQVLPRGAVGFLAHYCAVQIYDFQVTPHQPG